MKRNDTRVVNGSSARIERLRARIDERNARDEYERNKDTFDDDYDTTIAMYAMATTDEWSE